MPQMAFLKDRFDLTLAEARLVVRLVAGESLRSGAKALGIQYETVRTYLKSVFQKTKTHRQAELVMVVIRALDEANLFPPHALPAHGYQPTREAAMAHGDDYVRFS